MDYNTHSIKVIEKLLFSPLLSFKELNGITYITGHYTLRPPGTECKQLLYYMGRKALKNRICLWNFLGHRGGVGCTGVDYLAKSLNQINQCTKITIRLFQLVSLTAILQLSNVVSLGNLVM